MNEYASVYLLDAPAALDRPFDYRIPEQLSGQIERGSLVWVPFSNTNKRRMALVTAISDTTESPRVKDILDVNRLIFLNEEQLAICTFLKEYTLCTTGDAVRTLTPPLSAVQSALESFGYEILGEHLKTCDVENVQSGNTQKLDEALALIKKLK